MKTAKYKVHGKEYTLCFSLRVVRACAEEFGGMDKLDKALTGGDQLEQFNNVIWLLAQMMDAGERYDKLEGKSPEKALTADELLDLQGIDDIAALKGMIFDTMAGGEDNVDVEPDAKNATTSRDE